MRKLLASWPPVIVPVSDQIAAPRVLTGSGAPRWLDRYERARSPLDMGDQEAPIIPLSPVAYVPGAALLVRRAAIGDGFAPELRVAEDVDLCLRLHQSGWRLRYVPAAWVAHQPRSHLGSWLAQRARTAPEPRILRCAIGAWCPPCAQRRGRWPPGCCCSVPGPSRRR